MTMFLVGSEWAAFLPVVLCCGLPLLVVWLLGRHGKRPDRF